MIYIVYRSKNVFVEDKLIEAPLIDKLKLFKSEEAVCKEKCLLAISNAIELAAKNGQTVQFYTISYLENIFHKTLNMGHNVFFPLERLLDIIKYVIVSLRKEGFDISSMIDDLGQIRVIISWAHIK